MKRSILILALSSLLVACATPPHLLAACPGHSGQKSVTIYYDDSSITVVPKKKAKPKSIFVVKLKTRSKAVRPKKVTTDGISVMVDPAGGPPAPSPDWLDDSDPWTARKSFVLCVPDNPDAERTYTYKYTVTVEDVGFIDPRVEVTW